MIKNKVFKTYDIRGVYPTELDSEFAFRLGVAFSKYLENNKIQKKVVLGRDFRHGSQELSESFANGCIFSGVDVFELGICPTPSVYFVSKDYGAGVMVTASHNPKEYNGFKFCKNNGLVIGYETGLNEVEEIYNSLPKTSKIDVDKNLINRKNVIGYHYTLGLHKYIGEIIGKFKGIDFSRIKVVVDSGNGVASSTYLEIFQHLGIKTFPLHLDLDSNFEGRGPNPLLDGALDSLKKNVLMHKADLGIAFDGDADRIIIVDEKGEVLNSSVLGMILAKEYFSIDANFVLDIRLSKSLTEYIYSHGGKIYYSKVGQVYIKRKMMETDSDFGIEMSGHFVHKCLNYSDDAVYSSLLLLKQISTEKSKNFKFKLSDLHNNLKKYVILNEDIPISNLDLAIQKIREKYYNARMDFTDGITVNYSDWWTNIRPSNTEPLLRITLEADNDKLAQEKLAELKRIIN